VYFAVTVILPVTFAVEDIAAPFIVHMPSWPVLAGTAGRTSERESPYFAVIVVVVPSTFIVMVYSFAV